MAHLGKRAELFTGIENMFKSSMLFIDQGRRDLWVRREGAPPAVPRDRASLSRRRSSRRSPTPNSSAHAEL